MKKLISIFLLGLLWGGAVSADTSNFSLSCSYKSLEEQGVIKGPFIYRSSGLKKASIVTDETILFEFDYSLGGSSYSTKNNFDRITKVWKSSIFKKDVLSRNLEGTCKEVKTSKEEIKKSDVALQKGHSLKHSKLFGKAIEQYKEALKLNPLNGAAKRSLESLQRKVNISKVTNTFEAKCKEKTTDFKTIKHCLENHFSFSGKIVHPSIINEFVTSMADSGNQIASINLASTMGSNRYCCEDSFIASLTKDKKVSIYVDFTASYSEYSRDHVSKESCGMSSCDFAYSHLGTTDDGVIVILISLQGGGTLIQTEMLMFKVKKRMSAHTAFPREVFSFNIEEVILENIASVLLVGTGPSNITIKKKSIFINDTEFKIPPSVL